MTPRFSLDSVWYNRRLDRGKKAVVHFFCHHAPLLPDGRPDFLAWHEVTPRDIGLFTGYSDTSITAALRWLIDIGFVERYRGGPSRGVAATKQYRLCPEVLSLKGNLAPLCRKPTRSSEL